MRSRLVMIIAVAIALAAVAFAIERVVTAPGPPPVAHASLPPRLASYLGVFENGAPPSYEPLDVFAKVAGRDPSLVGYYSGWAEAFDTRFADAVRAHGGIPFIQIDPTYASVSAIAKGVYDSYLREFADGVRRFRSAVVLGFGHEMNAAWYPWGYLHISPATFKAAWRHIVDLFRAQGARNVTWLWTVNAIRPPGAPAAAGGIGPVSRWWPGASYVTWVGIDGFFYRPDSTFESVFGPTIRQVRSLTRRPILLSETAVGPKAGQFYKIRGLFSGMLNAKTLGLVWFDNAQHGSIYHQDWRIENNRLAELSFRLNVHEDMKPSIRR
jgi:mannan endo-1,4-beta-mannosidase